MSKTRIAGWAFAIVLVLFVLPVVLLVASRHRGAGTDVEPAAAASPADRPSADAAPAAAPGFLYGRVTTVDGRTYEGRLRWGKGGEQEAFWGDYFNGAKSGNPWAAHVPVERLPKVSRAVEILGFEVGRRVEPVDLGRLFMARFGDLARIEARGDQVRVTLKSGTAFDLARFEASDFDDGVRVWDGRRGAVGLDSLRIRAIELLPTRPIAGAPGRLHGTVRTRQGTFTGFVQWDREECVGSDSLDGRTAEGEVGLRFDTLRSIARTGEGCRVTRLDGSELELSGSNDVGPGNRGLYVDDPRYGRVLVSWDAFVRVDWSPAAAAGTGPAYGDFPPGRPLAGRVATRDGRRLAGRLVFDLDESETTETLDAPSRGVDYTLPFGLIAALVPGAGEERGARVTLRSGEELRLERTGDLGPSNAGLLVFTDGQARPEYVPWAEVERVDFEGAPTAAPPRPGPSAL